MSVFGNNPTQDECPHGGRKQTCSYCREISEIAERVGRRPRSALKHKWAELQEIFRDPLVRHAAVQSSALSPEQERILSVYLSYDETRRRLPAPAFWDQLGRAANLPGRKYPGKRARRAIKA